MTFANLSQATAASKKVYHRTQNTFNRIQNTYMSIEIHHQGWLRVKSYDFKSMLSSNIILLGIFNFNNAASQFELFSWRIGERTTVAIL